MLVNFLDKMKELKKLQKIYKSISAKQLKYSHKMSLLPIKHFTFNTVLKIALNYNLTVLKISFIFSICLAVFLNLLTATYVYIISSIAVCIMREDIASNCTIFVS